MLIIFFFHFAVFPKPKKAKKVRKIKTHNHNIPNALEMQIEFERRSNRENHFLEPETLQDFDNNDMSKMQTLT